MGRGIVAGLDSSPLHRFREQDPEKGTGKMADVLVVDRRGLAKKLSKRPKSFIVFELLQNAWDEAVTKVSVTAKMLPGQPLCRITVEDDCPEGFADIRSVYTLFRDSKKAPDPTKRGRFELGEKLVLALAIGAQIETTKGTVVIEGNERTETKHCRKTGTLFTGDFRMTREEFAEVCRDVQMLLAPAGIETNFNGEPIAPRKPLHVFETTLQTIRVDEEGNLKPTERKTEVRVYEVDEGEEAHIYEMGIPVVPTGDKWHYDIQQRVPINWERNNVPPSYLKTLRVEVLNAMHTSVPTTEATAPWVSDALDDGRCEGAALDNIITKRIAGFAAALFQKLTGAPCNVVIVTEPHVGWAANFGGGRLCLNFGRLGKTWFAKPKRDETVLDLLIHEFCHHTVKDHLSHEMHETATKIGAKLANIALDDPEFFGEVEQ